MEGSPNENPQEQESDEKLVNVVCGGCGKNFSLPMKHNVITFAFQCNGCGSRNEVDLSQEMGLEQ